MKTPTIALIALVSLTLACGTDSSAPTEPTDPANPTGPNPAVGSYLQDLPSWAEFAPSKSDQDATPTGEPSVVFDTVAEVRTVADSMGTVKVDSQVPYVCEVTPYSITRTPQDLVMYSPNRSILFAGAFIQGKTHRAGLGSLEPLIIDERAPIDVSIPSLPTGTNFRTVDSVDQSHVDAAVGDMVGSAVANGLHASSSIFFHMETYNSEQEFGLAFNASGHYLGFEGAVSGDVDRTASKTTVAAHFYQKMFTVVVAPPSTPGGWFTSAFTPEKLQQQVALKRIGPDNLPVYVGEIVYGRMMMFSVTSTASATEIQSAINASYSTLTGGGSGGLNTRQKKILSEATIRIASVGGNDSATVAMIKSGDWSQYFTVSAPLSTADPLSYTFYNVGDNSIASVTEATSYNVKTCAQAGDGQFDFLPGQSFPAPVPTPFETRLGDVNGDGRADLVFNHRSANDNELSVALGQADGTFATPSAPVSHPATPVEGWAVYRLLTGDFNGDGAMDLYWNLTDSVNNVYVGLANGAGGWSFEPLQQQATRGWTGYDAFVGDLDNDGDDDLIWNQTRDGPNYAYTALSNGDGTFALDATRQTFATGGFSDYHLHVADIDRDGRADLIWNVTFGSDRNRVYTRLSLGDGTFGAQHGPFDHPVTCCWGSYQTLVADVNRDQIPDMLWYNGAGGGSYLHHATGNGDGSVTFQAGQDLKVATGAGPYTALVGDVDGDGASDLILNQLTASSNSVVVARGTVPVGAVDPIPVQIHDVSTNWSGALPAMVNDVNFDSRADVVWVIPGSPTRVYVGRSRPGS